MKKIVFFTGVIMVSLLVSGCATMFSGKTQNINLTSSKPYKVDINGATYNSPSIITLDKDEEDKILTIKECNKKIILKREIEPTFWINILGLGAFGSTTDYASKSMWKYDQDNLQISCD